MVINYANGHKKQKESDISSKLNQSERIVELIEEIGITLFHDQFDEPHVRIKVNDHLEINKVRSTRFKTWISNELWKQEKKAISTETINTVLNLMEAKACFEGRKYTLHNRVARYEGAIWYDLGNWKAVKVTRSGWKIVGDPPILFKRYPHQKEQVLPQHTAGVAELDDIFKFVTITNEGKKLLYKANLISSFVPDIPHPIDILVGDTGTAKTTRSRIKKELVDPSHLDTQTVPTNQREFIQMADHNWFFTLDNLTSLPNWLSDGLCRVSTGDGFSKRRLYTDDEDFIYKYKRCACITGINLVATKPDLLDRSIIYELEPIPEDKRKTEKKFWEDFNGVKARILGACFTLLSKAMNDYETVALAGVPRMADFATWGCAVAKALGRTEEDFLEAYQSNIKVQNQEAIEASPVATLIIALILRQEEREGRRQWDGSPTELLSELKGIADGIGIDIKDKRFPKDPNWLWRHIKEVRTNLMAVGIKVSRNDTATERRITIEKKSISDLDGEDTNNDSSDNMRENGVTRKYSESLENDSTDSNDTIFEDLLDNEEALSSKTDGDIPGTDPWDEV